MHDRQGKGLVEMAVTVERTAFSLARAGYYLSMAAAVLFLIQGIMGILFRSIVFALVISLGVGVTEFLIGISLVVLALIVGSAAVGLRSYPDQHVTAGAVIVLFSLLALFVGGGYLIGSVLGIIGGVLAIVSVQK
ncbi:MAG: hypothetical protein GX307_00485 [Euryarchaeota archaeon]|nr:hypothetical protein [Euryarchaeota archaeon]